MLNSLRGIPFALFGLLALISSSISIFAIELRDLVNFIFSNGGSKNFKFSFILTTSIVISFLVILIDIIFISPKRRALRRVQNSEISNSKLTVALTAYNDEASIFDAVKDFACHPMVLRVIVVDNNSTDNTKKLAEKAGAIVINESHQGYGACVYRCLSEASKFKDCELIVLSEGDLTFKASDIDKLLAYITHADVVNGTRIVEQLRDHDTQLTSFMYFGNFAVGKLLELKHLGKGTITDVGTTYKICKRDFIFENLNLFNPKINHEFNAHFLDVVLSNGFRIVEVPITFHKRVGLSKGGNSSNLKALSVGIKMIIGIIFGWRFLVDKNAK